MHLRFAYYWLNLRAGNTRSRFELGSITSILGDPGAASLFEGQKSSSSWITSRCLGSEPALLPGNKTKETGGNGAQEYMRNPRETPGDAKHLKTPCSLKYLFLSRDLYRSREEEEEETKYLLL